MTIKEFLQKIKNTYSDSEYVNVVGTESDMQNFAKECENNHIWFYRICTFFVYQGIRFKIVFLKKENEEQIKKLIKGKNLVLNASNPFF